MTQRRCRHCDEVAVLDGVCQACGGAEAAGQDAPIDRGCRWRTRDIRCQAPGTMITPHGERYCGAHWGQTHGLADPAALSDPIAIRELIQATIARLAGGALTEKVDSGSMVPDNDG